MIDVGKLVGGFAIAALVVAAPLWILSVRGAKAEAPAAPTGTGPCVEAKDSMRRNHPTLLGSWRNQVVRAGQRIHITSDGRKVRIGLEETCLACHGEASKFCDRCHVQVGVSLSCWQCHSPSPPAQR
jgi:hypothetical protein